ncbi:MAG TPA: DUF3631 domain-containing protein [Candidatus Binataceae bacterium]|nr:DUF3631 domain-containing protein [Candidatus Binataceae bacterium]
MAISEKEFAEHIDSDLAEMDSAKARHAVEPMTLDATVATLAAMSESAYELVRKTEVKRFGIRTSALDKLVEAARKAAAAPDRATAIESLAPLPPAPWPEPVEGAALLNDVVRFIERFVILDKHAVIAVALWIAFTYCFDVAETSPRLRIKSPDKRCGKSRLLEVLGFLVPRSITASNMSASSVFRTIDAEHCPLFIDEADTFVRDNQELRGLLNSGHTRTSAYVIREIPAGERAWVQKRFSTWCPMAIAGIGKLPDTVEDRSVPIVMRRKRRIDKVERLTRRNRSAREDAAALASKLARLAADNLEKLRDAAPLIPDALNDRAADNWELLLAIADLAGGDWSVRARVAALALSGERDNSDEDSLRTRLLADIRRILEPLSAEEISSASLCSQLAEVETSPWSEFNRGKPISPARLSRMLRDFEIYVGKIEHGSARGYKKSDFKDSFERYLAAIPSDRSVQVSETQRREGESAILEVSGTDTLKSAKTPTERSTPDTLTLSNGGRDADDVISAADAENDEGAIE